jgi:hypothetical protein
MGVFLAWFGESRGGTADFVEQSHFVQDCAGMGGLLVGESLRGPGDFAERSHFVPCQAR